MSQEAPLVRKNARGSITEASMSEIMFWAPGSGIERVIVDEDMICLSQDEGSWTFLLDTAKTQGVAQM